MSTSGATGRREWHLTENVYLDPGSELALSQDQLIAAARITAGLVARVATRIDARTYREMRAGPLPRRPEHRAHVTEEVFDWLVEGYDRGSRPSSDIHLELHRGRTTLFELDRDLPFHGAFLTPAERSALQDALHEAGLPGDLCFPLSQRRTVVEPVDWGNGTVIEQLNSYGPLDWARRAPDAGTRLIVPTRAERSAAFLATCRTFIEELHVRELTVLQGRSRIMPGEVAAVRDLELHVHDLIDHVVLGKAPSYQRRPTAGWAQPPTAWEALDSVWPALTRLHPNDGVHGMYGLGDSPEIWHLWITGGEEHREYEIHDGVLFGPVAGKPTSPPPLDPTVLFRIPRRGWGRLVDSEAAVRLADESGGSRFRKTGGHLGGIILRRADDRWTWHMNYSRWRSPYSHDLRIDVDVRTGAVLRCEATRWLSLP
jgi:hypothetical protein